MNSSTTERKYSTFTTKAIASIELRSKERIEVPIHLSASPESTVALIDQWTHPEEIGTEIRGWSSHLACFAAEMLSEAKRNGELPKECEGVGPESINFFEAISVAESSRSLPLMAMYPDWELDWGSAQLSIRHVRRSPVEIEEAGDQLRDFIGKRHKSTKE